MKYALRSLARTPGFTAVAILTIACLLPARRATKLDPVIALRVSNHE